MSTTSWNVRQQNTRGTTRLFRYAILLVFVTSVAVVGTGSAAYADANTTEEYLDATNSKIAYQGWSSSGNNGSVTAQMWQTPASGYCMDSWFDWKTPEGHSHFDGRGDRTCDANTQIYDSFTESYDMNGMQKAGGAYGPDNLTTNHQYVDWPSALVSISTIDVRMISTNCSIRWTKRKGGSTTFSSGGDPTSASC